MCECKTWGERGVFGVLVRGLHAWRACIKESWEIELGAHSHVTEGAVDEMGMAVGAPSNFMHPKW